MRKKFLKIICFLVLLVVPVLYFTACTEKPWNYDNVIWYSNEPELEVTNSSDTPWLGIIKLNNSELSVQLLWGPTGSFEIIDYSKKDIETPIEDITILSGRVNYDKYTATLVIENDAVFDNKYQSIVLQKREIN